MIKKIDRYEIHKEIGRGAMGIVYMGYDPNIGRTIAIKTLRMDLFSDDEEKEEFLVRFKREAQTAGRLSHPNIVTIYDLGQDSVSNNLYIIMEFISGKNLKEIISEKKTINTDISLSILSQTADGLDFAHKNGIIHRDIKPANILLTSNKVVKITDFGIAKISGTNFTQTGKSLGTPSYMSPEQVLGKEISYKSDLFSFGALAYEVLTGEKAFKGNNITSIVYKILNEKPALPESNLLSQNQRLIRAILKCMDRDPEKRYASAADFVSDIKTALLSPAGESEGETQAVHMDMPEKARESAEEASGLTTGSKTSGTVLATGASEMVMEPVQETASETAGISDSRTVRVSDQSKTMAVSKDQAEKPAKGRSKSFWILAIALILLANIALFSGLIYFLHTRVGLFGKSEAENEIVEEMGQEAINEDEKPETGQPVSIIDQEQGPAVNDGLADNDNGLDLQGDTEIPSDTQANEESIIEDETVPEAIILDNTVENSTSDTGPDSVMHDSIEEIQVPSTKPETAEETPETTQIEDKPATDTTPGHTTAPERNPALHALKNSIYLLDTIKKNGDNFRNPRGFTIVKNRIYITEDPIGGGDPVLITSLDNPSDFKLFNSERLDTPSDIKLNKRGVIELFIVSDTNNASIKFFDMMGNLLSYIDSGHEKPFFIASLPAEEIFFITDYDTGHIYKYNTRGNLLSKTRKRLEKPMGLAMHHGILYVVDNENRTVHAFRPNLVELNSFKIPEDICDDPVGIAAYRDILLITDEGNGKIIAMTSKGKFAGTIEFPELKNPYYIEVRNSRIFISDNGNGYIYIYGF